MQIVELETFVGIASTTSSSAIIIIVEHLLTLVIVYDDGLDGVLVISGVTLLLALAVGSATAIFGFVSLILQVDLSVGFLLIALGWSRNRLLDGLEAG